jgi:hypothetical protein
MDTRRNKLEVDRFVMEKSLKGRGALVVKALGSANMELLS